MASAYPARGRTAWILAQRPRRDAPPDPNVPQAAFVEREVLASGSVAATGVALLTNRECPWRCLMCDLWKGTTPESVPEGSIPRQVGAAVRAWSALGPLPEQVKLYNSGSFFEPAAIAPGDYGPVAGLLRFARNLVVESHPLLVGDRSARLRDLLEGSLEVALGLETANPGVLRKLNKGFDLAQFSRASARLAADGIAMRAFLLVNPPFLGGAQALEWVVKSAAFAFDCGAGAVTLIPTRAGNGAMEQLLGSGEFEPPGLDDLEQAQAAVLALKRGRVFADTWDIEALCDCPGCAADRRARIEAVNLAQRNLPSVRCPRCAGGRAG